MLQIVVQAVVLSGVARFGAPPGAIAVRLPDVGQLTQAVRSGDEVEVERVAARLGAARLEKLAEHGKRDERLAALRALAVVEDAWARLPELSRLIGDADPDIAAEAAQAARRIAEGLTRDQVETNEVPRDVPEHAAWELLRQASSTERKPPVRVAAIAAVAALRGIARLDEKALAKLLGDGEPQVRRAAAEALAGVALAEPGLGALIASDPQPEVAAAAAASLCRDVPPVPSPKSPGEQRATRLKPEARARLRLIAADESLSLADRLDLLGCLRVGGTPADRAADQKVLDALAKKAPEPIKRRARSLGGK